MNKRIINSLLIVLLLLSTTPLAMAVPSVMSYQGKLNDNLGNPINGTRNITFAIYDAASLGNTLWTEVQDVTITNGIFNIELGAITPIAATIFESDNLYLGIKIGTDSEMIPRQRITSGAYAFMSGNSQLSDRMLGYLGLVNLKSMQLGTIGISAGQTDGWGEVYTDSNGAGNSVSSTYLTATFDVNKYTATNYGSAWIIIEADDTTVNWTANDTKLIKFSTGKWILYGSNSADSDELKRAKLHKSLWYGTTGANQLILNFQNLTAIKTSVVRDVGKKAYFGTTRESSLYGTQSGYYGATILGSTGNDSLWSYGYGTLNSQHHCYSGVLRNASYVVPLTTGTYNEVGIDTSADETLFTSINLYLRGGATQSTYFVDDGMANVIFLTDGLVSWAETGEVGRIVSSNINYLIDYNIPEFTATNSLIEEGVYSDVNHTIPTESFSSAISQAVGIPLIEGWEVGADIQYKLTNLIEDTGWLPAGNDPQTSYFPAFTAQPTHLHVRLIPSASNPTLSYPSIKGFWIYAE